MNTGLSESEQMYLVTIARLNEAGQVSPIPLTRLAEEMSVLPVSVNQMVRKLAKRDLVIFQPYKGVRLTPQGQEIALRILRHRRLWEVFLVDHLGFQANEANQLACRLEHTLPAQAAERLAAFLGDPKESPRGLPIPGEDSEALPVTLYPLSTIKINQACQVIEILSAHPAVQFLEQAGIKPGTVIRLVAASNAGDLLVEASSGELTTLAAPVADQVMVLMA